MNKITMEIDLSKFGFTSGSTEEEMKDFIVNSILRPARAHAQIRRRQPGIGDTPEEETYIARINLIDQAKETLLVAIDEAWRHALSEWE